jgi:hypothetical protein
MAYTNLHANHNEITETAKKALVSPVNKKNMHSVSFDFPVSSLQYYLIEIIVFSFFRRWLKSSIFDVQVINQVKGVEPVRYVEKTCA